MANRKAQLRDWEPAMTRRDFVTVREAAEMLGFRQVNKVREALRDGRLTGYRPVFGQSALLLRADIERLIP